MENNEGCSQGGQEGMVPPNLLQNCTCKKFKSGKILREGGGHEASSGMFLHGIITYPCVS